MYSTSLRVASVIVKLKILRRIWKRGVVERAEGRMKKTRRVRWCECTNAACPGRWIKGQEEQPTARLATWELSVSDASLPALPRAAVASDLFTRYLGQPLQNLFGLGGLVPTTSSMRCCLTWAHVLFFLYAWYIHNPHGHQPHWFFFLNGLVEEELFSS